MRSLTAGLLWLLHIGIVAFVIFGWLSPSAPVLFAHLFFLPLMVIHWKTNHGKCILTQWETGLRQHGLGKPAAPEKTEQSSPFIAAIILAITGKKLKEETLNSFIYGMVYISFGLTAVRVSLAY